MLGHWKDAMPRRRWVDWANCLSRSALGTSYIFEMNFYYQAVLSIVSKDEPDMLMQSALTRKAPFFLWDASSSISSRDVASKIKRICERGTAARHFIQEAVKDEQDPCPIPAHYLDTHDGLTRWVKDARKWVANDVSGDKKDSIRRAISGLANRAARNMQETIVYALLDRGRAGVNEDLYSLLKKRGSRYTIVEPGQEWFVVVSSMQASDSRRTTRVADVIGALESLGIRTGYNTIVKELERAGLGRTSHDADDAIEVVAAF
jgi:hypothetical protein